MSISVSQSTPVMIHPPVAAPAAPATEVHRPWLWLLVIVAAGFGMRWWQINEPLQADEFGSLYATVERQGTAPLWTPAESAPLTPVASWEEVRTRSVLPYGINNPYPVYN